MTIHEITETEVVQECANCGAENRIPLASLQAGVERQDQVNPRIVPLPMCACGSGEFLICPPENAPEHPAPGSFSHLHQLMVIELQSRLVQRGRMIPKLAQRVSAEGIRVAAARTVDESTRQRWFPNGWKLPRLRKERSQG